MDDWISQRVPIRTTIEPIFGGGSRFAFPNRTFGFGFRNFEEGSWEIARLLGEGKLLGEAIWLLTELRARSNRGLPWWHGRPLLFDATGRRPPQV